MYKFLLWATYASSALATFNQLIPIAKRQSTSDDGIIKVTVGVNGTLRYSPEEIDNLPIGTVIEFDFMPKNHTVTESSFDQPCHPIAANVTQAKGRDPIKTGFVPVNASDDFTKAFRIRLSDTKPIWLYCGQTKHCQSGMVMVINQNNSDTVHTLANFRAAAAQVPLPDAASSSTVSAPGSTATAATVNPVTPASTTTGGPSLAASATASTSPSIGVFNAAAPPKAVPVLLAAVIAAFSIGSPFLP